MHIHHRAYNLNNRAAQPRAVCGCASSGVRIYGSGGKGSERAIQEEK